MLIPLNTKVDKDKWTRLKVLSATTGLSLIELLDSALEHYLDSIEDINVRLSILEKQSE